MKVCDYCGRENDDDAVVCRECGTENFKTPKTDAAPPEQTTPDFVTLVTCRTLGEADTIVSELAGAGIEAFIPDEFLSQAVAWNIGDVRVQVASKDYELAKAFLAAPPEQLE